VKNEANSERTCQYWRLYLRFNSWKWNNFVTTNMATFYVGGSYGRRRVWKRYRQKLKFVKHDSFVPGFMVWIGVSFYGKSSLKITSKCMQASIWKECVRAFINGNVQLNFCFLVVKGKRCPNRTVPLIKAAKTKQFFSENLRSSTKRQRNRCQRVLMQHQWTFESFAS
jgi:hypothetical protein